MSGCSKLKRKPVNGNTGIPVAILDSIKNCKDSNTHVVEHEEKVYEYTAKKPTYIIENKITPLSVYAVFIIILIVGFGIIIFVSD